MSAHLCEILAECNIYIPLEIAGIICEYVKKYAAERQNPIKEAINTVIVDKLWKQRSNDVIYMIEGFQKKMVSAKDNEIISDVLQKFMRGLVKRRTLCDLLRQKGFTK